MFSFGAYKKFIPVNIEVLLYFVIEENDFIEFLYQTASLSVNIVNRKYT